MQINYFIIPHNRQQKTLSLSLSLSLRVIKYPPFCNPLSIAGRAVEVDGNINIPVTTVTASNYLYL